MFRHFDLLIINEKILKNLCENMFVAFFQNTLHYTTRKIKIQQKKPQKKNAFLKDSFGIYGKFIYI